MNRIHGAHLSPSPASRLLQFGVHIISTRTRSLVGAGLPAMVVNDDAVNRINAAHLLPSPASRLLQFGVHIISTGTRPLQELARQRWSSTITRMNRIHAAHLRPSPASRLLQFGVHIIPPRTRSPVGAGSPAMVVNDNAHEPDTRGALASIASKPAPTVWRSHYFDSDAIPCRSWLASDSRQR